MKKVMLVVFNGEEMCFVHVLLNALDMAERSWEAKIILEGASTKLIPEIEKEGHFLNALWVKVKDKGLVEGACRACSNKMAMLKDAEKAGLRLLDDMSGHPGLSGYMENGFEIITF